MTVHHYSEQMLVAARFFSQQIEKNVDQVKISSTDVSKKCIATVLRLQMHSYARHLLGDTEWKGVFVNLWNGCMLIF